MVRGILLKEAGTANKIDGEGMYRDSLPEADRKGVAEALLQSAGDRSISCSI